MPIYQRLVSKIPIVPGIEAGEFIAKKLRDQPDLVSLKDRIDELLRSSGKRILVIIDDIDRLTPEEICDLFRTVKAAGNFPNVIYLLAFDTGIVVKSLERELIPHEAGKDYLEKIVQVPFSLPLPDKIALRDLLTGKLNEIIAGTKEENFSTSYWQNMYFLGLDQFISTPRDVIRLTNVLQATYPGVKDEVNAVDFIAIEAIRVFLPNLYDEIRSNMDPLTNAIQKSTHPKTNEERKAIFDEWLEPFSEDDGASIKNLLSLLFPKFSAAYGGITYGLEWETAWTKEHRICSVECFPVYFRFSLGPDSISNAEIEDLLRCTGDRSAFGKKLLDYTDQIRSDGSSKLRAILNRLEYYTKDDIPEQNIQPVICSFFDIGDKLLLERDEPHGMFGFGNSIQIGRIIHQLLMRENEETRFKIVSSAIRGGSAISVVTHEAVMWGQEHGKFSSSGQIPKDQQTFSEEHLKAIEGQVVSKIVEAAKDNSLLSVPLPHLVGILHAWSTWTGLNDQARAWVNSIVKTDEGLVSILPHFGFNIIGQNPGDVTARIRYRLDPEQLKPYIDPDKAAERLMKLDTSKLNEGQKKAVSQFLYEYELRKERKIPI